MTVGDTVWLVATVKDASGTVPTDRVVTWASSDPSVATVSATGLVTGMGADPTLATITATSEGVSGQAAIAVTEPMSVIVQTLAAGHDHTCALTSAGAAYCWGSNEYGPLGDGSTTNTAIPVALTGGVTFRALTAGGDHSATPVAVTEDSSFIALTRAGFHTCGVASAGAALCWGWNDEGQLANGAADPTRVTASRAAELRSPSPEA